MARSSKLTASALFVIALGMASLAAAATSGKTSTRVEGVDNLEGVREMAATLILRPGSRFEFGAIYGGADPRANGTWSLENNIVHLVSDTRPPTYTRVEQDSKPLPDRKDSEGVLPLMSVMIAGSVARDALGRHDSHVQVCERPNTQWDDVTGWPYSC